MAERVYSKPTDADKIRWRTDDEGNTVTEPNATKRADGWAYRATVPHGELNWVWQLQGDYIHWLGSTHIREFSDLHSAIENTSYRDRFTVYSPSSGMPTRWAQDWITEGGAGASTILYVCSDGQWIYQAQGNTAYKASPVDGADQGETKAMSGDITHLQADGTWLYVTSATSNGVYYCDPADIFSCSYIADKSEPARYAQGNGSYMVCGWATSTFYLTVHEDMASSPSAAGSYNHGGIINDLAISDDCVYLVGADGTGNYDIRSIDLGTQSPLWSVDHTWIGGTKSLNVCATDGRRLYVGHNDHEISGTHWAQITAYNGYTGQWLWDARPFSSGNNAETITCDDKYVYLGDDNENLAVIDKRNGDIITAWNGTVPYCADGIGLYGTNASDDLVRYHIGGPNMVFMRADPTDPTRRPNHYLAVPITDHGF